MWLEVATFEIDPTATGRKTLIPSPTPWVCRFCERTRPAVKFSKDAHAIPVALGNRYLLTQEECDDCNTNGSKLETDLSSQMLLTRVMSRIPGRSGGVKHRFGDRPSWIASVAGSNDLTVDRTIGDDSLDVRRTREGLRYRVKVPAYRPLNALRAIARLGFMLVPSSDLPRWDHIRRWIRGEVTWPSAFVHDGFIPGAGLRLVRVGVYMNANAQPGEALFRIGLMFGTAVVVMHLPMADMALADAPIMDIGRSPYPPHEVRWVRMQVRGDEVLPARYEEFDVHVPALAAMEPPSREHVAEAAYFRWLARGGHNAPDAACNDWLDAEQQLLWAQVPAAPQPWPPMPTS